MNDEQKQKMETENGCVSGGRDVGGVVCGAGVRCRKRKCRKSALAKLRL